MKLDFKNRSFDPEKIECVTELQVGNPAYVPAISTEHVNVASDGDMYITHIIITFDSGNQEEFKNTTRNELQERLQEYYKIHTDIQTARS